MKTRLSLVCIFVLSTVWTAYAQQPTAVMSGSQSICEGMSVTVTVTLTGTPPWTLYYEDTHGITVKKTGINQSPYVFSESIYTGGLSGNFHYYPLSVSDSNPNTESFSVSGNMEVIVLAGTDVQGINTITITGSNPINCSAGQTILSVPTNYSFYQWFKANSINEFVPIPDQKVASLNVTSTGSGTYNVKAYDVGCNITKSNNVIINAIEPFVKPVILGDSYIQCGVSNILTATAGFLKYEWKINNVLVQTGITNTINASSFWEGDYTVTAYNSLGCSNSSLIKAITKQEPFEIPSILPTPVNGNFARCIGGTNILNTQAGYVKYEWTVNTVIVKTGISNTIDANLYGNGVYKVIVYNANGCSRISKAYTVFMESGTSPAILAFPSKLICPDQPVQLALSSEYVSYLWSTGSVEKQIAVTQPGTYSVSLTDISGCVSIGTVVVTAPQLIQSLSITSVNASRQCVYYNSPSVTLNNNSYINGYNYNWYKDGVLYYSVTKPFQITVYEPGSYTLKSLPNPSVNSTVCYTESNAIDVVITAPPTTNVKYVCGSASSYVHTANGADVNQIYKWWANGATIPLYISSNYADNTYASNLSSVHVSIYDQISGCETARTKMDYVIDPINLPEQNITVCSSNPVATLSTTLYSGGGTYKWYSVSSGGTPIYTSTTNTYTPPAFSESKIVYVEYVSSRGCQTNRAAINVTFVQPLPPVINTTGLCIGSGTATIIPSSSGADTYYLYDSPTHFLNQNTASFSVPISGNKVYYVSAVKNTCVSNQASVTINAANLNPLPTSTFTITPSCNQSAVITYTGNALPADLYTWNFNGGTIVSGIGAGPYTIKWTIASTYTISLQVKNANGCIGTNQLNYTVKASPQLSFVLNKTIYCQNDAPVTLPAGSPAGGVYSGIGVVNGIYTPSVVGTNTITYSYTDPLVASCIYTKSIDVNVNPIPVASFTGLNSSYCQNAAAAVLTGSPAGGVFSGNGISGTAFTPSALNTNTVHYTVTNSYNCSNKATQSTTVYAVPAVSFTGLNTSYCQNAAASVLTGTPAGGVFSGVGVSNTTYTPSAIGTNTISYTYSNGCTQTASKTVTVNPIPTVSFTGLNTSYCQNAVSSVLTGNPAGGAFSGNGISGNTFVPQTTGTNTVTYTYIQNGCTGTSVQTTTVNALLTSSISISGNTSVCNGFETTFTSSISNGGPSPQYQWRKNGIVISGATSDTYTSFNFASGDVISSLLTSNASCVVNNPAASNSIAVTVKPLYKYLYFDGIDRVTVPANDAYNLGSGDFSISADINISSNATPSAIMPILSRRTTAGDGFYFYTSGNQLVLQVSNMTYKSNTFYSIKDGNKNYVGVTRQNGIMTFYINENPIGNAYSTESMNTTANLSIGYDAVSNVSMKGYISDVMFSNVANEFKSLAPIPLPKPFHTIGEWISGDCTGQIIRDISPVSNNGILGLNTGTDNAEPSFGTPTLSYDTRSTAIDFQSVFGLIEAKHIPEFNWGTSTDFTIEAIVVSKTGTIPASAYPTIVSKGANLSGGFMFGMKMYKLFFQVGGITYFDSGNYSLESGCHYVAVSRSGTTYTFYVDGIKTSTFISAATINSSQPFWIGNATYSNCGWGGKMDEVRIWNTAKSESFIQANSNAAYFPETTPNLIGYYRFNEIVTAQSVLDGSIMDNRGFMETMSGGRGSNPPRLVNTTCPNYRMAMIDDVYTSADVHALVYPNPFDYITTLKITNLNEPVTIQVLDASGTVVFTKEDHPSTEELILGDDLPQGMYLIHFVNQPLLKPLKFIKVF